MRANVSLTVAAVIAACLATTSNTGGQQPPAFVVEEATIATIHDAMRSGALTCRGLVEHYLRRIEAYDQRGPAINSLVQINTSARDEADALDRRFKSSGLSGPLHCIPTIVK